MKKLVSSILFFPAISLKHSIFGTFISGKAWYRAIYRQNNIVQSGKVHIVSCTFNAWLSSSSSWRCSCFTFISSLTWDFLLCFFSFSSTFYNGRKTLNLTLSQTNPDFTCLLYKSLKTLWEKKKMLVMSNFFLSHSVFYPFREVSAIFIESNLVICKLFQD